MFERGDECKLCDIKNEFTEIISKLQNKVEKLEKMIHDRKCVNKSEMEKEAISRNWKIVKNKQTPAKPLKPLKPIETHNKFSPLNDIDTKIIEIHGDETVFNLENEFCARDPKKRKNFCYPKLKIDDLGSIIKELNTETAKVLILGKNDIAPRKIDRTKLLAKYRTVLMNIKNKQNVAICGILPTCHEYSFLNKAFNFNINLKFICKDLGIKYLDYWNNFYNEKLSFNGNLNPWGTARLGRLINKSVCEHFFGRT